MTSIAERLARLRKETPSKCLLCKRRPRCFGVFVPKESTSRDLGAPAGKTRLVSYGVCLKCLKLPDVMKRIENRILASTAEALSRPEAN